MSPIFIQCPSCLGEGREFQGHPNDPDPRDGGPCWTCNGERVVEVETQPITMEDLDEMAGVTP